MRLCAGGQASIVRRMRNAMLALLIASCFGACGKDDGGATPKKEPPAKGTAPAPAPAPAPAQLAFAGTCTVTVPVGAGIPDVVVCTEYNGVAAEIEKQCTASNRASTKTQFSPDRCPTAGLVGKCSFPHGHHVDFHYSAGGEPACKNAGGTWTAP